MTSGLQSVSRESLFTRLDFRPKLLLCAYATVIAFLWESPVANAGLLVVLLLLCAYAGVRGAYLRLIFKVMSPFYVLMLLTHGFWNVEQVKLLSGHSALRPLLTLPTAWWAIGGASLSLEGTLYGISVICKTLALVLVIPLTIFTTDVDRMIVGMVQARIPYKLTFVFSATLRFFPVLCAEIQTIIEAQRLRGLALERMGPLSRVRIYARVAVPLILGAMVKAQQLEVVLQSKGFTGSPQRTFLHESRLQTRDYLTLVLSTLGFAALLWLYLAHGVGKFRWGLPW